MTQTRRIAFVKANWHAEIVGNALKGFEAQLGNLGHDDYEVMAFNVPGAFEIPLMAKKLLETGKYDAVVGAAFVVNGGIYHHEFVSAAVVDGLMRAQLDTGKPVFSVSLTPHNFQETPDLIGFFRDHFITKGQEAANAVVQTFAALDAVDA